MLGQRWRANKEDGQPVVKIGAKAARLGVLRQRPVSSSQDAHVHLHGLVVAHTLQFPALHKAQQLGLQGQRHLADLVQKQRASVGRLDASDAPLHRTGKCAAGMAEEFRFQQRLGNRRAVDGHKGLAASRRQPVQRLGHQFLARSGGPFNQYRRRARSHQADAAADLNHARGVADQFRQPLAAGRFAHFDGKNRGHSRNHGEAGLRLGRNGSPIPRRKGCLGHGMKSRKRPRTCMHPARSGILLVQFRRGIPCRRVGVLRAPQSVEQFLAIGAARALLRCSAANGQQVHIGKEPAKVLQKLRQIQIGQP